MRRTCFVSIPFGVKVDASGHSHDFDALYHQVLRPAVEEIGIDCRRLDDFAPGTLWHKTLFSGVVGSDILIADLTTGNPNVLYELGIRHALRRARTILISAGEMPPGNLSYLHVLLYAIDAGGNIANAETFRAQLQEAIQATERSTVTDSPLYEFFPDLEVSLPAELENVPRRRKVKASAAPFEQIAVEEPARARSELAQTEAVVRGSGEIDATEYLTVMRRYRDLSEWDRVIDLADEAPAHLATLETRQMLALALNRRGHSGDQDRAIALMEQTVAESGGDAETFGVLGRIYKDRCERARKEGKESVAQENLERALHNYRLGFAKNPTDFYSGINVISLLLLRGDAAAEAELAQILPQVRGMVEARLLRDRFDYWDVAAAVHLAAIARDWPRAHELSELAMKQAPSSWMTETTLRDLRALRRTMRDPNDREQLEGVFERLASPGVPHA
jgi:tetratricopeptide (TPR) repeat protein